MVEYVKKLCGALPRRDVVKKGRLCDALRFARAKREGVDEHPELRRESQVLRLERRYPLVIRACGLVLHEHFRRGDSPATLTPWAKAFRCCTAGDIYAPSSMPSGGGEDALVTSPSLSGGTSSSDGSSHLMGAWANNGFFFFPSCAPASESARSRSVIRAVIAFTCAESFSARAMRTLGAGHQHGVAGDGEVQE